MPLKKMSKNKCINLFWLILLLMTLIATLVAETANPSHFIVLTLCLIIAIKGRLVMDEMMAVREAIPIIRYTIYSYFILLPVFIALSVIFPEILVHVTTLND